MTAWLGTNLDAINFTDPPEKGTWHDISHLSSPKFSISLIKIQKQMISTGVAKLWIPLNSTDSTLMCPVKIEYGPGNNIFALNRKLMMKSGLEKIILKFLLA